MCSVATKAREMVDDSSASRSFVAHLAPLPCLSPCHPWSPLVPPWHVRDHSSCLPMFRCAHLLNLLLPQRIAGFVGIAGLLLAAAPRTATAWPGMKSAGLGATPHSHGLGDDDASHIGPSCTVGVGAGGLIGVWQIGNVCSLLAKVLVLCQSLAGCGIPSPILPITWSLSCVSCFFFF